MVFCKSSPGDFNVQPGLKTTLYQIDLLLKGLCITLKKHFYDHFYCHDALAGGLGLRTLEGQLLAGLRLVRGVACEAKLVASPPGAGPAGTATQHAATGLSLGYGDPGVRRPPFSLIMPCPLYSSIPVSPGPMAPLPIFSVKCYQFEVLQIVSWALRQKGP